MLRRNKNEYPFEMGYPQLTAKLGYGVTEINAALVALMSNEPAADQLLRELNPALDDFIDLDKHPIYRKRSDSGMLHDVLYYGGSESIEDYKEYYPATHECCKAIREFLSEYYTH